MPNVLLTLASEGVRGEAFLPEWQVPASHMRPIFSAKNKQTTYSSYGESLLWSRTFC